MRARWTGSASQGLALIGLSLVTSETRAVTGAEYSTAGNSITTTASATGLTLTASGATLSGATATAPSSGTYTVSGTPNAGDQITATINGVAISYTLNASDTLQTAAAMLAAAINANWTIKGYVRAVWNFDTIVTVYSKLGNLTVAALTNAHNALLASPTVAPVPTATASGSLAGRDVLRCTQLHNSSG